VDLPALTPRSRPSFAAVRACQKMTRVFAIGVVGMNLFIMQLPKLPENLYAIYTLVGV
jgi:hypothetical protein